MKLPINIFIFLVLGILSQGCLSDMATRPENDLEAIYKCRLDVHKQSCEKTSLWWLLGLN